MISYDITFAFLIELLQLALFRSNLSMLRLANSNRKKDLAHSLSSIFKTCLSPNIGACLQPAVRSLKCLIWRVSIFLSVRRMCWKTQMTSTILCNCIRNSTGKERVVELLKRINQMKKKKGRSSRISTPYYTYIVRTMYDVRSYSVAKKQEKPTWISLTAVV